MAASGGRRPRRPRAGITRRLLRPRGQERRPHPRLEPGRLGVFVFFWLSPTKHRPTRRPLKACLPYPPIPGSTAASGIPPPPSRHPLSASPLDFPDPPLPLCPAVLPPPARRPSVAFPSSPTSSPPPSPAPSPLPRPPPPPLATLRAPHPTTFPHVTPLSTPSGLLAM